MNDKYSDHTDNYRDVSISLSPQAMGGDYCIGCLAYQDELLDILLIDRSRTNERRICNIMWMTDFYAGHKPTDEIKITDITSENWPIDKTNWRKYIAENKLKVTRGETPFIVSRHNTTNGKTEFVGSLDRKLQVVSKFCDKKSEWLEWAKAAFKASYGYEWQGDDLLLARENLLYTFINFWNDKFPSDKINLERKVSSEKLEILKEIVTIISWNIFQMDGLKYVVPMSCKHEIIESKVPPMLAALQLEKPVITKNECYGCKFNDPTRHNGKKVKIMDWEKKKPIEFYKLLNSTNNSTNIVMK